MSQDVFWHDRAVMNIDKRDKVMIVSRSFRLVSTILLAGLISFGCTGSKEEAVSQKSEEALAYVSTQKGNVIVIDLKSMEVKGEIQVGAKGPRGIGVTADGKTLITANGEDGDISVINRNTGELIKRIAIGENPEFVRVRGEQVFVSYEPAAIGGPPPAPGSEEAEALAKAREEDEEEPAQIAIVDLVKGEMVKAITGGMETEGIEFSADGKKILVTNEADENITVHDIDTGNLVKTISTQAYGNRPRGIKAAPSGEYYVGSLEFGDKLVIIDSNFNLEKVVTTGKVPYGLAFDEKGERLFVALKQDKALEIFDTKSWESIKKIPTGERCWHFTFTPDNSQILVACGRSDEVVVIDMETLEPIKSIPVPNMPWGIVTYPKAIGSLDIPN